MAVILATIAFWASVTYQLPGDMGKPEKLDYKGRYKRLKTSERRRMQARLQAHRLSDDEVLERLRADKKLEGHWAEQLAAAESPTSRAALAQAYRLADSEFLDLVLVDWEIKDAQGAFVPHTPATRAELFEDWDGLEAAFVRGYFDAFNSEEAGAKNSAPPSATT